MPVTDEEHARLAYRGVERRDEVAALRHKWLLTTLARLDEFTCEEANREYRQVGTGAMWRAEGPGVAGSGAVWYYDQVLLGDCAHVLRKWVEEGLLDRWRRDRGKGAWCWIYGWNDDPS